MTTTELLLPKLGETVTEGTITRWFKGPGDRVEVDEVLYEVSTEKVDSEVPSPLAGVIVEIRVPEGETVDVGTVLAMVDTEGAAPAAQDEPAPVAESEPAPPPAPAEPAPPSAEQPRPESTTPDGHLLSPMVRRLIREHDVDVDRLAGTGVGGRVTRDDVLGVIDEMRRNSARAGGSGAGAGSDGAGSDRTGAGTGGAKSAGAEGWTDGDSRFEPFNNIRRRTGEHMVRSVAASPHALTVMEVDYENVEQVRRAHRADWRSQEGFSLTYLPFIVTAVTHALAEWPRLNASVEGEGADAGLRVHRRLNVGVAVDLDHEGLIVPVLHDADSLSLRGAARAMNELAERARSRRLGPDDIAGGTFTISNNGSFGTYTTAAIINQPQVAVLSTDGVARRPVVAADAFGNESVVVHSVGHLAMGWDHRAFDGGYAAGFLGRVKNLLETHDWEAEI